MAKLSEWVVKQQRLVNRDRLLGDDGELFLQMPSNGTKTWVIEYELNSSRTKYTIGRYSRNGGQGDSISSLAKERPAVLGASSCDCRQLEGGLKSRAQSSRRMGGMVTRRPRAA